MHTHMRETEEMNAPSERTRNHNFDGGEIALRYPQLFIVKFSILTTATTEQKTEKVITFFVFFFIHFATPICTFLWKVLLEIRTHMVKED